MNVDGGSDRVMKIGRSSNSRSNSCKHCPCRLCASSISLRDFTDDDFLYASTSDKLKLKRTINFKPARKKVIINYLHFNLHFESLSLIYAMYVLFLGPRHGKAPRLAMPRIEETH